MIVYGQKEEYFEAKWLKNEWGRFIRMIDEGIKEDGSLIVCYENMNPNNLPNRLKKLQCLNLSDKTSYITLDKVLNKLINQSKKKVHTIEEVKIEKGEIKKVTEVNIKNVEIYAFNDTIQEVTKDEEVLLEIADDYLSQEKYIEAKEKYEKALLINKYSYKTLFGIILATNKCNSKETFINNLELVSKNIKDIDAVIKACDKETALNVFLKPLAKEIIDRIKPINEEICFKIFDCIKKYDFPMRSALRDKLIEYSINTCNIYMFDKVMETLEKNKVDLHISYKERMQNSLIKEKKFEEAAQIALDTLNNEEGNTTSLYNLFICHVGNKNIITSIDDEAYKLIDKIISYEKTPNDFVINLINLIINTKYVNGKEKVLENLLKRIQNDNELRCNYSYKIANNLKDERQFDKAIKFYNYYLSDTKVNQELGYEGLLLCKYKCINAKELININEDFSKSDEYEKLLILSKRNNNELYKKYFNSKDKWIEKKKEKHKKVFKVSIISLVIVSIISVITSLTMYANNSNNGIWKVVTEPTETEEGIIGRYVFGIKMEEIIIPNLNDGEYNITINKESTCEEEGKKTYTYTKDGRVYTFEKVILAKGHDFDSWKVDITPTTKESGQISRICKNDSNHTETKELPILDDVHYTLEVQKDATCTEEGKGLYTFKKDKEIFKFEDLIPISSENHDYDSWKVDITPTIEEPGQITRICKNDSNHTETIELPILDDIHYTLEVQKEATCTEEGKGLYIYKKDGNKFTFENLIPSKKHNYNSWNIDTKPTKEEPGQISRICKNDSNHIETKELPILDNAHYALEWQKAATCEEPGIEIYRIQINDEEIIIEDKIKAIGHNYIKYVCSKCGTQREYYTEDGYFYFGSYPQIIKDASVTINNSSPDENGYYMGNDNEKYDLVIANPYYNNVMFSNDETIVKNQDYYFKVEPIKWKVLEDKDGKVFLFSELVLDAHKFDSSSKYYSSSSIRAWLNNEFYNKAFTDKQKVLIENTTLKDISNVTDKVFLLSKEEITNTSYGFSNNIDEYDNVRCKKVTDYAKANRALEFKENKNGTYWLRTSYYSYYSNSSGAYIVNSDGCVLWYYVDFACIGVVPALSFCKAKA